MQLEGSHIANESFFPVLSHNGVHMKPLTRKLHYQKYFIHLNYLILNKQHSSLIE